MKQRKQKYNSRQIECSTYIFIPSLKFVNQRFTRTIKTQQIQCWSMAQCPLHTKLVWKDKADFEDLCAALGSSLPNTRNEQHILRKWPTTCSNFNKDQIQSLYRRFMYDCYSCFKQNHLISFKSNQCGCPQYIIYINVLRGIFFIAKS